MDMPEPLADWEKEMMLGSQRVVSVSYMGTTHTFPVDSEAPEGEETLNFLEYSEIDEVYLPEGETPEPDYTAYREAQPESGEQDEDPRLPESESESLYEALVRLTQGYGFLTDETYTHLRNAVASVRDSDPESGGESEPQVIQTVCRYCGLDIEGDSESWEWRDRGGNTTCPNDRESIHEPPLGTTRYS